MSNYGAIVFGEEGAEVGVELVELLAAVALVRVVADLAVGARAVTATGRAIAAGGGAVIGSRGQRDVVVEARPLRMVVAAGDGEYLGLQRRYAARERVSEHLVLVPHCRPAARSS